MATYIRDGEMTTGGGLTTSGYSVTFDTQVRLLRYKSTNGHVVCLLVKCDQGFVNVLSFLQRKEVKHEITRVACLKEGAGFFPLKFTIGPGGVSEKYADELFAKVEKYVK